MSVSLHEVIIGTYQQLLPQMDQLITKAEDHCAQTGTSAAELGASALAPDMWGFAKQLDQCAHHSAGAIKCVGEGVFSPAPDPVSADFGAMRSKITDALEVVGAVRPGDLEQIADRDVIFQVGDFSIDFTTSGFLLSFSLPNFYFHCTTAYNILRHNGFEIGKLDFLGKMRTKG